MAKRLNVRYNGGSAYTAVQHIPVNTVFKGVESRAADGSLIGVFIRGSSLRKASGLRRQFCAKQYLFVLGRDNSEMVAV